MYAVCAGSLTILKWAMERGCELNNYAMETAIRQGNLDIVQWIDASGYEWNPVEYIETARSHKRLDILKWIRQKMPKVYISNM